MSVDFAARGLARGLDRRQRQLRTLHALRASIAANLRPARVMAAPPAISVGATFASAIGGTHYKPCENGKPHAWDGLYTFTGGEWAQVGTSYPAFDFFAPVTTHQGNGSDPGANPLCVGASVRWMSAADDLEIAAYTGAAGSRLRLKVDGEYVAPDATSAFSGGPSSVPRFLRLQFAESRMRRFELIGTAGTAPNFGGVKCAPLHRPQPWPNPIGIRACIHGDSMVSTISDSASPDGTVINPAFGMALKEYAGLPDLWLSNVGGTGFVSDNGGSRSNFLQRLPYDVLGKGFDVIWEIGGLNDPVGSQAAMESWFEQVIADNPAVLIFATGPQLLQSGTPSSSTVQVHFEKKAAAARYPDNVAFLDNVEVVDNAAAPTVWTNRGWVHGTGRIGSPTGDGNADAVRGADGTHPCVSGGGFLGWTLANRTLAAIDALSSRLA